MLLTKYLQTSYFRWHTTRSIETSKQGRVDKEHMTKFNPLRIERGKFEEAQTIPCIQWHIDPKTAVEIRCERCADPMGLPVILDLDWPLAAQPVENRKESLC